MAVDNYRELAKEVARQYGLDENIFVSMIDQESKFDSNAVSEKGAIGLGQLMPKTAKELGVDPKDPKQNLDGSARYLKQHVDYFDGDYDLALAAYNSGRATVIKHDGIPPYKETQKYVQAIKDSASEQPTQREETHTGDSPNDLIFQGLREDYPELAEFEDDVLFETVRQFEAENGLVMDDSTFRESLLEAYAPSPVTPSAPAPPKKSFLREMAEGIKESIVAGPQAIGMALGSRDASSALEGMDDIGYQDLIKRGYSPEIAAHVMRQRIGTQKEMATELQATGEMGEAKAIEGAASYLSTGATMGLEGLVLKNLMKKGLGSIAKMAMEGAFGVGGYEMIRATGEGKSAGEIFDKGMHGAKVGAVAGPVLGLTAKHVLAPIAGKMITISGGIPRYVEQQSTSRVTTARQALATQADNFAEQFNGDWMRTRFADLLDEDAATRAANKAAGVDTPVDVNLIAGNLIRRTLGNDVLAQTSEASLAKIGDKIRRQQLYVGLDPNLEPQKLRITEPIVGTPPRVVLDNLLQEIPGGMAPEPNTIGSYSPAMPTQQPLKPKVKQAKGIEGVPTPSAAPQEPIVQEVRPPLPGAVPLSDDLVARSQQIGTSPGSRPVFNEMTATPGEGGMAPMPGEIGTYNPAEPKASPYEPRVKLAAGVEGSPPSRAATLELEERPIFPGSVKPEDIVLTEPTYPGVGAETPKLETHEGFVPGLESTPMFKPPVKKKTRGKKPLIKGKK